MSAHSRGVRLNEDDRQAFTWRVLRDAYLEADRAYWLRRAQQLEAARPRRGDYFGAATSEQIRATYDRLTAAAQACRARAGLTEHSAAAATETLTDLAHGDAA